MAEETDKKEDKTLLQTVGGWFVDFGKWMLETFVTDPHSRALAALVDDLGGTLKAPPHRITLPDAPVPYSGQLEARYLPSPAYVAQQVDALVTAGRPPLAWWEERT